MMKNNFEPSNSASRRAFLKQSAVVSLGFLFLSKCSSDVKNIEEAINIDMITDPNGYMDLPEGFSYKVISKAGNVMSDGFMVPGRADGMGAFEGPDGTVIIIRNHENSPGSPQDSPFGLENELFEKIDLQKLYDPGFSSEPALGGTTTIVYNEETGKVEREFLSLAGTTRNCAGGVTPWNSWLTCEEDTTKQSDKVEKDHGFVFEVPATLEPTIAAPTPLLEMGRFMHEAVCVDPKTGIVYQTEDRHDGLIYRFIPNAAGKLAEGGKLQALAIKNKKSFDTRNWEERTMELFDKMPVEWIDIEDVLSPEDDLRLQGYEKGGTRFARGEGIWFGNGELFFACTNGGPEQFGQIFRYVPSPAEGTKAEADNPGTVDLFAESESKTILHNCDNLTIAPWGDVILCEDNGELNHIRGINKKGEIYNFGCNRSSRSEFAGLVFSPSGKTLFVNIQENGDTVAITGPWDKLAS
ncbi:MAG: alkaline phosphatase PhoX [Bacteroidota bacterium]